MTIYLTIIEDRHTDVEVYPFSSKEKAVEYAKEYLETCGNDVRESVVDGWLYHAQYSPEGDSVWVVARELDEG